MIFLNKKIKQSNILFMGLVITGIFFDIFLLENHSDVLILVLFFIWVLNILTLNLKYKISFLIGLIFLTLNFLLVIFNNNNQAEKAAVWAYLFFLLGTIQVIKKIFENKI